MKTSRFVLSALFAFLAVICAQATIGLGLQMPLGNPSGATADPNNHSHYLIERPQYSLDYNDTTREANWVSWSLTSNDVGGSGRSDDFFVDTSLPPGFYQVQTTDYAGSGYDRGHMCPSADRTVTRADNDVTFFMSNMVPQTPDNNRGIWANFETYCRTLASAGNEVLITCGTSGFAGSTVASGVAIPGYTWKIVVVVPLGPGSAVDRIVAAGASAIRVIAIKVPNIAGISSTPWQNFVTSAAQIQTDTGYTFFTALPGAIASALRNVVDGSSPVGSPVITSHPATQTTVVGGSATFSVTADGDAPLSYQWLHEDIELPGATGTSLTLAGVQAADVGTYYVVVTNNVGSTTSNAASLIVTGLPPVVIASPVSQTVSAGANVTFAVTATGSPTLAYQWRKNFVPIGGANSTTLTLAGVQAADAASYDVVITNSAGAATSATATLTVNPSGPVITTQPASRTAVTAENASFTVAVTGTAPLTYQWRKDGTPLADGGVISGSATATLLLSGVTAANGGSYDVVITNALGSATSNAATLLVNPPPPSTVFWDFGPAVAPTALPTSGLSADITGGLLTQVNNNGTTPLLTTVSASTGTGASGAVNAGAATVNGGLNLATSTYFEFTLAPGAGKRLLATGISFRSRSTGTGPQALAVYSSVDGFTAALATATNGSGTNWTLYSPAFTAVTGLTGTPITFRIYGYNGAGATGSTAVWRIDDLRVTLSAVFPPPVAPAVTATSPANGATNVPVTNPITVTFNEAVGFTGSWFAINSATAGPLTASVTGGPTTFSLATPSALPNNDTVTVTIFGAQVVDQASGTLHGTTNTTFSFTTEAYVPPSPPSITGDPSSQVVNAGSNATFVVTATGTAPLNYQWRKNGTAISGNSSASTASLTLTATTTADAGAYDCVVSNVAGSDVSAPATLTVNVVPPAITTQPMAQMAAVGGGTSFTVAATGTGPLGYQWRHNGVALNDAGVFSGTHTPTLVLTNVTHAEGGSYDVVVTNAAASVTSRTAMLAVTSVTPSVIYWDFATASPASGIPAGVTGGMIAQGNNNGTTPLLTTTSASNPTTTFSGGNNAGAAARVGPLVKGAPGSAYFEFTFTPPAGRQFAAGALAFGARSTGTGPQAYSVFTSADGFADPVAAGALGADSVWRMITTPFAGVAGAVGSPVTFRIYGHNGSGGASVNTANWRIDDVKLTAGLLALPPVAPAVAATLPAAGATNVALAAPITITFNQAVNVTGTWFTLSSAAQGPLAATASGGPETFTLTPAAEFAYGDVITVTVKAGQVTEQATGTLTLPADSSFSFTTVPPVPPTITTQPAGQTVMVGDPVSFTVAATGTAPFTYQWRKNGEPVIDNPSATSATLMLSGVVTADAGNYDCVVTNQGGAATSDAAALVVNKAPATVMLGGLTATYDGTPKAVSTATSPAGLNVFVTYNGSALAPTNAGSYAVVATVIDANYAGGAAGTLVIDQATATVTLSGLEQAYDGSPKTATAMTNPAGLAVTFTYDGSATPPTYPGSYAVVATLADPNHSGSATATLHITTTAQVRHAPSLNGGLDGSIQVMLPESITLNGNAWVSGDLLMPGTPSLRQNGSPLFGGTVEGPGNAAPSGHSVTLNGGAALLRLVRRIDAIAMPVITAPPAPAGSRDVSLNKPGESAGDFTTLRNLTLNGNGQTLAVPAGTYGTFTLNGNNVIRLGEAGGSTPAIYNLQGLTLNGSSQVQVVGPVIINLAAGTSLNGVIGSPDHPEWLTLNLAAGGLTLNGNSTCHGVVIAPAGTVTLNGNSELLGRVVADRLVINGNGVLTAVEP